MINIPTYVIHHNPEYWPEPELFKPERCRHATCHMSHNTCPSGTVGWSRSFIWLIFRFLKENADQIVPYSWLPFGAGPRACIGIGLNLLSAFWCIHLFTTKGERFAMAEMKMALAKVVSKFRVEADETTKIEFQKGDQAMMSYHGVYVRMVPRWIAFVEPVSI